VQVHVTAAPFAHGGFGAGGNLQFGAALKTGDEFLFRRRGGSFRGRIEKVLNAEVLPALFANLVARMSPNNSALDLTSIFSLAVMLPVILPRTVTDWAVMLPLTTAPSPKEDGFQAFMPPLCLAPHLGTNKQKLRARNRK
jgi:hypothetical protein